MSQENKPDAPKPWECCGGGCSPCVWDRYYDELHAWNQANGIDQAKVAIIDDEPEYR
jgi:hypothetical protein